MFKKLHVTPPTLRFGLSSAPPPINLRTPLPPDNYCKVPKNNTYVNFCSLFYFRVLPTELDHQIQSSSVPFRNPSISVPKNIQRKINELSSNRANFNENPSMRAIAKILRARTSEHLSKFCEQFEQRPNFAST